jgi:hypothetical protein
VVLTKEELLGMLDRLEGQNRLAAGNCNTVMGHEDVKTTEIYTHVATGVNGCGVRSPLDG